MNFPFNSPSIPLNLLDFPFNPMISYHSIAWISESQSPTISDSIPIMPDSILWNPMNFQLNPMKSNQFSIYSHWFPNPNMEISCHVRTPIHHPFINGFSIINQPFWIAPLIQPPIFPATPLVDVHSQEVFQRFGPTDLTVQRLIAGAVVVSDLRAEVALQPWWMVHGLMANGDSGCFFNIYIYIYIYMYMMYIYIYIWFIVPNGWCI